MRSPNSNNVHTCWCVPSRFDDNDEGIVMGYMVLEMVQNANANAKFQESFLAITKISPQNVHTTQKKMSTSVIYLLLSPVCLLELLQVVMQLRNKTLLSSHLAISEMISKKKTNLCI